MRMTNRQTKMVMDYMVQKRREGADFTGGWKLTDKSLVTFDTNNKRTIIPLTVVMDTVNAAHAPD
jgi:hypothetical protein